MVSKVLADYAMQSSDKIRYADTDRQGHVNNAAFATFLETGRAEIFYDPERSLAAPGCAFVIANLNIDFQAEINWPGSVQIGSKVSSVGRSSVTLEQAIFQDDQCVAIATTVIVQMNEATRKSHPLSTNATDDLATLMPGDSHSE